MGKMIKTGARKGKITAFRKWISKLAAPVLVVFPVPGEDYFRSSGIYLDEWFDIATNPREANVLLVAGTINEKLAQKVAVAYLQMPRPRALVFAGANKVSPLPDPDHQVDLDEKEIRALKSKLIRTFQEAYRHDAENFEPEFIKEMMEDDDEGGHQHGGGHGDHEGDHDHHGKGHEHHGKGHEHHGNGHEHHGNSHEHQGNSHDHHGNGHEHHGNGHGHQGNGHGHHGNDHEHHGEEHGGHDHGGHDHGSMGFMSMVEMTKDMPRATDGLAMERNQVWFGPFFPGFPGGLAFQFTIDGDTVVKIKAEKKLLKNSVSVSKDLSSEQFLEELAALNPMTPNTYRILGEQLLKKSRGENFGLSRQQVSALERERILSHLNWLSILGSLAGNQWLKKEAAHQMQLFQKHNSSAQLKSFIHKLHGFKLLKNKLQSTGKIPEVLLHHTLGPVARATGQPEDTRSTDETYQNAGFETVSLNENNAWGRLEMRLKEIDQGLEILQKLKDGAGGTEATEKLSFGTSACVQLEGPAGMIKADLQTDDGQFKKLTVNDASAMHTLLAEQMVQEMELSDALITIASLDINPFAVREKHIECQTK